MQCHCLLCGTPDAVQPVDPTLVHQLDFEWAEHEKRRESLPTCVGDSVPCICTDSNRNSPYAIRELKCIREVDHNMVLAHCAHPFRGRHNKTSFKSYKATTLSLIGSGNSITQSVIG